MPECTFVLLTNPNDVQFVNEIIQHLLRMCSIHFREVIVVADDLPQARATSPKHCHVQLFELIEELLHNNTVSRCVRLSTIPSLTLASKYFGSQISATRDHRGVPLFGWIAGLESAKTDFVVHFDSDILLHQAKGHDWINEGITLIQEDPLAMFVSPLPGPPTPDRKFFDQDFPPTFDKRGNFRFKTFSSRRFLVSKDRLDNLLPTPMQYISNKRRLLMQFGLGNALWTWEYCVSYALERSKYYRVNLRSPNAWAIHCPNHGRAWLRYLPALIKEVECGNYPVEQGGHYDLLLSAWNKI